MSRLLLVDDEMNVLEGLRRVLCREKDLTVECHTSAESALTLLEKNTFDLIMSDYMMPEMDGVTFLTRVRAIQPQAARIILSRMADRDALASAINDAGVYRFIMKPVSAPELLGTIRTALNHQALLAENASLAEMVRQQRLELDVKQKAMDQFARDNPQLAEVDWDLDGSIVINTEDMDLEALGR